MAKCAASAWRKVEKRGQEDRRWQKTKKASGRCRTPRCVDSVFGLVDVPCGYGCALLCGQSPGRSCMMLGIKFDAEIATVQLLCCEQCRTRTAERVKNNRIYLRKGLNQWQ